VSFDTSSATAMSLMFYVRSAARALPPHSPPAGPFACAACARRCRTRAPGLGIGRAPRALWSPLCPQPSSLSLCGPLCVRAACARAPAPHANPTPQLPRAFRPAHTHTSPGISHALLSTRQEAKAFNQRPWFDLSSAEDMGFMFTVRSAARICPASRTLQPRGSSAFAPLVLPRAARSPACVSRAPPAHLAPRTSHAPLSTWQGSSLSAANRLLIRCAWAGTPAFDNALPPYDEIWAPGSCL